MAKRPIYYDTETTGTRPGMDRVIEIAAFDPKENRTFSAFINPEIDIPEGATAIHGITNEMVQDAPTFKDVGRDFFSFCEGEVVLIAHNNDAFDKLFLIEEAKKADLTLPSWPMIDTLKWARKYRPDLPRHSLQFLRQIYGVAENRAHRALNDVMVLHEVFSMMIDDLSMETVLSLLSGFSSSFSGDVMPFGKHQGKPLKELPPDYIAWLKQSGALDKAENQALKEALSKIH